MFSGWCFSTLRSRARYLPSVFVLLPCCVYFSLHTGLRALTVCSARALTARYQFGSRKDDVGHVGGDVPDVGAIGD